MENVHPTFAGILRGFEVATIEPLGRRAAVDRINHADTEFDADYATVVGPDARSYQIGSFIEWRVNELFEKRGKKPMQEDEYRRRVADGQDN